MHCNRRRRTTSRRSAAAGELLLCTTLLNDPTEFKLLSLYVYCRHRNFYFLEEQYFAVRGKTDRSRCASYHRVALLEFACSAAARTMRFSFMKLQVGLVFVDDIGLIDIL